MCFSHNFNLSNRHQRIFFYRVLYQLTVEQETGRRKLEINKPMTFQQLGGVVWEDSQPQSHRAQHPWLLSHEREGTENVKQILKTLVEPQI